MMRFLSLLRPFAVLCAALAVASCDSPSGPDGSLPARLDVVSGSGQEGTVGTELAQPLVVRVTDRRGRPVSGQIVNFRVVSGGGGVFAGTALTDARGEARERWTLGTSTADSQRVEARVVDSATGEAVVLGVFRATAHPDAAAAVVPVGDSLRSGEAGALLPMALEVTVRDRHGNPVPGAPVVWTVRAGGGTIAPQGPQSDSLGRARAAWTLGPRLDSVQVAEAAVGLLATTRFRATATPPSSGVVLVRVSGDGQSGAARTILPQPLVVRAQLPDGRPIQGAVIQFSSPQTGSELTPESAVTNAAGEASVSWRLPYAGGAATATARMAALPLVSTTFTATVVGGSVAFLSVSPTSIVFGGAGARDTLQVHALDEHRNPVPLDRIDFTSTNPSVATVTDSGVVVAAGRGTAVIRVTGDGRFVDVAVTVGRPMFAREVQAGYTRSCAVEADGDAFCWGQGGGGQLGNGESRDVETPARVAGGHAWATVDPDGADLTCGLTTGGAAFCWGGGASTPAPVTGGMQFSALSVGMTHACALTPAGAAYCWGDGRFGRLGNGDTLDAAAPVPVSGGLVFRSISAGTAHTCGVTPGGEAYCWGLNSLGALGVPLNTCYGSFGTGCSAVPVRVQGGHTFAAVSAGNHVSCALTPAGQAWCWGSNGDGTLGNGTTSSTSVPSPVAGGHTFGSLSLGASHACGVTTSGAAYCWGRNVDGQLGIGTSGESVLTPVPVGGGVSFQSVDAGLQHTCGIAADGGVYCWGTARLGTPVRTHPFVPGRVVTTY